MRLFINILHFKVFKLKKKKNHKTIQKLANKIITINMSEHERLDVFLFFSHIKYKSLL